MKHMDEHDHCVSCGIRIPLLPEDATPDEQLCDGCLAAKELWLERPLLQRVNAEILDAACAAANAIAVALYYLGWTEADDIEF